MLQYLKAKELDTFITKTTTTKKANVDDQKMQKQMKCSYITPIHKTVDVILELSTCTRIDAHVSGTLEMREMCP